MVGTINIGAPAGPPIGGISKIKVVAADFEGAVVIFSDAATGEVLFETTIVNSRCEFETDCPYVRVDCAGAYKLCDFRDNYHTEVVTFTDAGEYYVFRIKKDGSESDPDKMIEWVEGCDGKTPAHMDYLNDTFDYGGWDQAFFIKKLKVVMLGLDGEVKQELDPNDYSRKIDGTLSDYDNPQFEGNVMVGLPKAYYKFWEPDEDGWVYCKISTRPFEGGVCYPWINRYDEEVDYCYLSVYEAGINDGYYRSISGLNATLRGNYSENFNFSHKNGDRWEGGLYIDWVMLTTLGMLISRSVNFQDKFGVGRVNTTGGVIAGTLNQKGLFWGENKGFSGIKYFGLEHFWGNYRDLYLGVLCNYYGLYVKLTSSTRDGSGKNIYDVNTTTNPSYMVRMPNNQAISSNRDAWIYSRFLIFNQYAFLSVEEAYNDHGQSATTFLCDANLNSAYYVDSMDRGVVYFGGAYGDGQVAGPFSRYVRQYTHEQGGIAGAWRLTYK